MEKSNHSPLQLKHYHFLSMGVSAREGLLGEQDDNQQPPYPDFGDVALEPEVSLFSSDEDGDTGPYVLRLAIKHTPAEDSDFPYAFEAVVEGVFEVPAPDRLDNCKRQVVINGASMLYSAAREQLLSLTSRHLYGPMLLPSLNFQHLDV